MQVNHVAELREQLTARSGLDETASEAAAVRQPGGRCQGTHGLAAAVGGRLQARLDSLAITEARVREVATRCREKVVQVPPLQSRRSPRSMLTSATSAGCRGWRPGAA